jgi:hypothetical protein
MRLLAFHMKGRRFDRKRERTVAGSSGRWQYFTVDRRRCIALAIGGAAWSAVCVALWAASRPGGLTSATDGLLLFGLGDTDWRAAVRAGHLIIFESWPWHNGYEVAARVHLIAIWLLGLVLAAGLALGVAEGALARRRVRRAMGRCPSCSYDRGGLGKDAACPECGGGA